MEGKEKEEKDVSDLVAVRKATVQKVATNIGPSEATTPKKKNDQSFTSQGVECKENNNRKKDMQPEKAARSLRRETQNAARRKGEKKLGRGEPGQKKKTRT